MFIEATKLIGLPVATMDTQTKIGEIRQILVNPENGQLLGFLISPGGIFASKKVLSVVNVTDWDPKGIVTNSEDNLVPPDEIVRLKSILAKKIYLLGMSAKTESGKGLGIVDNFLVDTEAQTVVKYYLKDILGKSRIFSADKVSKIDKAIIFTDDVVEPPTGAVGAAA